jgi:hypothetical protein
MSTDKIVEVHGLTSDNATLLLAAAEELDLDQSVVATTSQGYFLVPEAVAKKAGLDHGTTEDREKREFDAALARDNAEAGALFDTDGAAANSEAEGIVRNEDGSIDPEKSKKDALVAAAEAAGLDSTGTKTALADRLNQKG